MRNRDWYQHAVETIKRIKEMRQCNPLNMFCSPEHYLETLEDFTKLIYGINKVSDNVVSEFNELENSFDIFKERLFKYCDTLSQGISKRDNDTP